MHSPGDWQCKYSSGDRGIHGPDGRDIALIRDLGEYTEGNTNLFLAAPDMLFALEAAEMALEGHEDRTPDWHKLRRAAYRTVQDAIAKAKAGA